MSAPPPYSPLPQQQSYPPPTGAPYPPEGTPYDPSKMPPPQPQPGYPVPGQPSYQQYNVTVQPSQNVVIVGGCPACRVGVLEDDFTCLGVFCAIVFFPIGILCCLAMRQRRCANCGAIYG